ncbi:MAG: hypothetical protein ACI83W_000433 [Marinoscillum sp.]|jgi:hypothetical protein
MENFLLEIRFWSIFLILNYVNYVIVYLFHYQDSSFFPHITTFKKTGKIGLTGDTNLDFFRYSVELSVILIGSRFFDLHAHAGGLTVFYFFILFFNLYQYTFRKIYESEPILFNDITLIKNGIAILWNESKWKILFCLFLLVAIVFGFYQGLSFLLIENYRLDTSLSFKILGSAFILVNLYSIYRHKGFYLRYPNDIYLRFHYTFAEFIMNLKKSYECYQISQQSFGKRYQEARENIKLELVDTPPNIHFIFIESYGSFFYQSEKLAHSSYKQLTSFQENIAQKGYHTLSNLSESTTTGGQSWLTYSSVLFGYRMDNNTLFENLLNDPNFGQGNGLMQIFKKIGYTNYNLNPISPINGITVPYDAMRGFYGIDRWILNKDINYKGDKYGFGTAAPDQYSMNFTSKLIEQEKVLPYTFFYLTKSSHSPFPKIKLVDDWQKLNQTAGSIHQHEGFLKFPTVEDYGQAIKYQIENLEQFISDHKYANDLFLLMGDHQPPVVSKPKTHGLTTPVHIISKNKAFLDEFKDFGFVKDLRSASKHIKHESFYSIFLNAFSKHYAKSSSSIPAYEPNGLQL